MRRNLLPILLAGAVPALAQAPPSPVEAKMIQAVDAETPASIALLEQLVNINSGTMNLPGRSRRRFSRWFRIAVQSRLWA